MKRVNTARIHQIYFSSTIGTHGMGKKLESQFINVKKVAKMKTFEGIYTIKWGKNTAPDISPIVFDCESKEELKKEQQRIIAAYSKGDDKNCAFYQEWHDNFLPPHSIIFKMSERK